MKKLKLFTFFIFLIFIFSVKANAETGNNSTLKFYGFIRNYMIFDTRENSAGTLDLFYYLPKDTNFSPEGQDLNANPSFRLLAVTTRMGVNITGYQWGKMKVDGKIEGDFYCMNGNVATLRLRQALLTLSWQKLKLNIGQTWHPMAADMVHGINVESGAPFTPFSRTPQIMLNYDFSKNFAFTGGILYGMQYLPTGPSGKSADYMKYGMLPEFYAGLSYKNAKGFLARIGVDVLSISPRKKIKERFTGISGFVYAQYTYKDFQIKAKSTLAQAGEHLNLLSGYGVSEITPDGTYKYTPLQSSASFISAQYGKKLQILGMLGYAVSFGAKDKLYSKNNDGFVAPEHFYYNKSGASNMKSLVRFTPSLVYNFGKLSLGIEYDLTAAFFAKSNKVSASGLVIGDLRRVINHRILTVLKFTF